MVLTPVSNSHLFTIVGHSMNDNHLTSFFFLIFQYKNQQREIQFQLRRQMDGGRVTSKSGDIAVLTIDQCQGQEAELVILSLVRKPTRFLNKNRLNVAMSRTKKELIILCDRSKFHQASQDTSWECCYMAQDILRDAIDEDD
jgi:superfamily I DNA and/or RNA helicase